MAVTLEAGSNGSDVFGFEMRLRADDPATFQGTRVGD